MKTLKQILGLWKSSIESATPKVFTITDKLFLESFDYKCGDIKIKKTY